MSSREELPLERPSGLAAHDIDVVGLVFGLFFLICAALAVAVRTGSLGFGADEPSGAWISGALLAAVGVIGVIGTLATLRRRARVTPAARPAPPIESPIQGWVTSADPDATATDASDLDAPDPDALEHFEVGPAAPDPADPDRSAPDPADPDPSEQD